MESKGKSSAVDEPEPKKETLLGTYTVPLLTGWKAPWPIRKKSKKSKEYSEIIWKELNITVSGEEIPPPIMKFEGMRFAKPILEMLKAKAIVTPTAIQVQCLPIILSGRDMIGIASTSSGKSLAFVLTSIMLALQGEVVMPIARGEGPFGLVIGPSTNLAKQTYEDLKQFLGAMKEGGYPALNSGLCIASVDDNSLSKIVDQGVHIVVATPWRLRDALEEKKMSLEYCTYLALDDVDKFMNINLIEDILRHFKAQCQKVLFSTTMDDKIDKLTQALVKPVTVVVSDVI